MGASLARISGTGIRDGVVLCAGRDPLDRVRLHQLDTHNIEYLVRLHRDWLLECRRQQRRSRSQLRCRAHFDFVHFFAFSRRTLPSREEKRRLRQNLQKLHSAARRPN